MLEQFGLVSNQTPQGAVVEPLLQPELCFPTIEFN